MKNYSEIYDLFIDLINGKTKEVSINLAEMERLSRMRPKYDVITGNIYISGLYHTPSDILKELCEKNHIYQSFDYKNNCYKFVKEIIENE